MSSVCKLSNGNQLEIRDLSIDIDSKNAVMRFEKDYNEVIDFLGTNIITTIDLEVDGNNTEHYSTYLEANSIQVKDENLMDRINKNGEYVFVERVAKIVTVYLSTPNVSKQIEDIKSQVGIVNPDTLTLDEYKTYRKEQSKKELESYLLNNPLRSSVHGSTEELYAITESKQFLLLLEINMKNIGGDSYISSWNASGKKCEPWTLEELVALAGEMAAVVKPLVSYQQSIEEEITAASTIEDVKAIIFDFSGNDPRTISEE